MNRAALYLRSSKDRADVSIDAQRRALHELAIARGLVVVDEYSDAVESGKDEDRPAFVRLVATLERPTRSFEHVLALDTSRIARRRLLALRFEEECARAGVRVVYRNVPDGDPATEMLLRSVLQTMDEWHSLTSRQKGLAGMAENVRQGWRAGGRAPRGYALEYSTTGAVRDGAPVLKSKLKPNDDAPMVRAYLQLRARGVSRGQAIARLKLPWPSTSTHAMDWQALTYAGHTVFGMHSARVGGAAVDGEKRRPRSEWQIQRGTHPALIADSEAEAILVQMERALQGRRMRTSPLLLTGLVQAPDGTPWHSDGCGSYRMGKGRKVIATKLETAVLERLAVDLAADECVARILDSMRAALDDTPADGRTIAGLERRIATLTERIGRTVDLAAGLDDPAPVLRRVADLEHQRAELVEQMSELRARNAQHERAQGLSAGDVRAWLATWLEELREKTDDAEGRAEARMAIAELVERIELDPTTMAARVHYAVAVPTGDKVASPRGAELTPLRVTRWVSPAVDLQARRRKIAA